MSRPLRPYPREAARGVPSASSAPELLTPSPSGATEEAQAPSAERLPRLLRLPEVQSSIARRAMEASLLGIQGVASFVAVPAVTEAQPAVALPATNEGLSSVVTKATALDRVAAELTPAELRNARRELWRTYAQGSGAADTSDPVNQRWTQALPGAIDREEVVKSVKQLGAAGTPARLGALFDQYQAKITASGRSALGVAIARAELKVATADKKLEAGELAAINGRLEARLGEGPARRALSASLSAIVDALDEGAAKWLYEHFGPGTGPAPAEVLVDGDFDRAPGPKDVRLTKGPDGRITGSLAVPSISPEEFKQAFEKGLAQGAEERRLARDIGMAPGQLLVDTGVPIVRNVGELLKSVGRLVSAPFTLIGSAATLDGAAAEDGAKDLARGLLGLVGLDKVVMGDYRQPDGQVTGSLSVPEDYAKLIAAARKEWWTFSDEEQLDDRRRGMKAWHTLSYEKLAAGASITELPWIFLGGLIHEADPGGATAEIETQGLTAWLADTPGDVVANTLGFLGGLLLPESTQAEYARSVAKLIPGPPDPFEGGVEKTTSVGGASAAQPALDWDPGTEGH